MSAEPIPDTREQSTPVVANGGRGFLFRTLFPRRGVHWMCRLAVFPFCFDLRWRLAGVTAGTRAGLPARSRSAERRLPCGRSGPWPACVCFGWCFGQPVTARSVRAHVGDVAGAGSGVGAPAASLLGAGVFARDAVLPRNFSTAFSPTQTTAATTKIQLIQPSIPTTASLARKSGTVAVKNIWWVPWPSARASERR